MTDDELAAAKALCDAATPPIRMTTRSGGLQAAEGARRDD